MQFTQNSEIQNHKHVLRYAICTGPQHHHWNDRENKNFITTGMDIHTYTVILFFLQMHNDPKEWFYSPTDHDQTFHSAKQNTIC